jgi:hypothetical protein
MYVKTIYFLHYYEPGDSVGIETGYFLDGEGQFPAGVRDFSPLDSIQFGSGVHVASYPMGIAGSFPRGKAAGA